MKYFILEVFKISEFQQIKNYEEYQQNVVASNIKEISDFALSSEKRATEIFQEILLDIQNFFKIHTLIEFKNVSDKFFKKLVRIVNTYLHYKKNRKIRRIDLEFQYSERILLLLSKRKIIFNDILLNYLTKKEESLEGSTTITKEEMLKELTKFMSTTKKSE